MRHSQHERELGQSQQHEWETQSTQGGVEIGKREETLTRRGRAVAWSIRLRHRRHLETTETNETRRGTRRMVHTNLRFLAIVEAVVRDGR